MQRKMRIYSESFRSTVAELAVKYDVVPQYIESSIRYAEDLLHLYHKYPDMVGLSKRVIGLLTGHGYTTLESVRGADLSDIPRFGWSAQEEVSDWLADKWA
jgi:hypothetical protein